MQLKDRVILKQGATFRDLSVNLQNYVSGSEVLNITAATDYLYIGSSLPFNHRHFEIAVANALTSRMSVQILSANQWIDVAEITDETLSSGHTLAQSGVLQWVPDKYKSIWTYLIRTEDVAELSGLGIYDLYWAKIIFSGNLTSTTALGFVGHKFSSDEDLFSEYPDLNDANLMRAFKSGKTDWKEQAFRAAEYVIQDLKKSHIIRSKNQILDYQTFKLASVHKVAQMIFGARGSNYKDRTEQCRKDYRSALDVAQYQIDQDMDGVLSIGEELDTQTRYFSR